MSNADLSQPQHSSATTRRVGFSGADFSLCSGAGHHRYLVTNRADVEYFNYHLWCGYRRDLLRDKNVHHADPNPFGAVMVLVLLATLLVQSLTGVFSNDEIFNLGTLYGYISNELTLKRTSLHRILFYWILGAAAMHILAVIAHRVFKGENLVDAMFVSRKPADYVKPQDEIKSSRLWLAMFVLAQAIATLAWYVKNEPGPAAMSFM